MFCLRGCRGRELRTVSFLSALCFLFSIWRSSAGKTKSLFVFVVCCCFCIFSWIAITRICHSCWDVWKPCCIFGSFVSGYDVFAHSLMVLFVDIRKVFGSCFPTPVYCLICVFLLSRISQTLACIEQLQFWAFFHHSLLCAGIIMLQKRNPSLNPLIYLGFVFQTIVFPFENLNVSFKKVSFKSNFVVEFLSVSMLWSLLSLCCWAFSVLSPPCHYTGTYTSCFNHFQLLDKV